MSAMLHPCAPGCTIVTAARTSAPCGARRTASSSGASTSCYASLTPGPHVRGRHQGEIDMAVKITARPNGPYLVEGEVELYDPAGNKVDTTARGARIALCRCGGSVTKPFCDGTHSKIGFQAAEAAVAQEQK